ncbi:MAG: hypothetical protein ACAI43_20010 [Phycisphaerae bacterium]
MPLPFRPLVCPKCGGRALTTRDAERTMMFAGGTTDLPLTATVPEHACTDCGHTWIGPGAEEIFRAMIPDARAKLAHTRRRRTRRAKVLRALAHSALPIAGCVTTTLKLTGHLDAAWAWVLAPFWLIPLLAAAWTALWFTVCALNPPRN